MGNVESNPKVDIPGLEKLLKYRFKDHSNILRALTHVSARHDFDYNNDYERLEFFGDRILGFCIAEKLYKIFPDAREGELSLRLNALVNGNTLAAISDKLGLHKYIKVASDAKELTGYRMASVRADVVEAIIAAIYFDGGIQSVSDFIDRFWRDRISETVSLRRDSKTELQEWAHTKKFLTPVYHETGRCGPDHEPEFTVVVEVDQLPKCVGYGRSKRLAEQNAARAMLTREGIWDEAGNPKQKDN